MFLEEALIYTIKYNRSDLQLAYLSVMRLGIHVLMEILHLKGVRSTQHARTFTSKWKSYNCQMVGLKIIGGRIIKGIQESSSLLNLFQASCLMKSKRHPQANEKQSRKATTG